MKKLTPNKGRRIFTSRGIKEEMECGLVIPAKFLRNSNVGTDDLGRNVIVLDNAGHELDDGIRIVYEEAIIATIENGSIMPSKGFILGRKCEDPKDESGLVGLADRKNQFVEVLAGGYRFGIEDSNGWLAYVSEVGNPQKVEDSEDDWLIPVEDVKFFYKGE